MGSRYTWKMTPLAEADIDGVLSYITEQLSNRAAAARLLSDFDKAINSICEFPMACAGCEYYFISDANCRHAIIGNYVLFYRVNEDEKQIEVLRFIYSGRNIGQSDIFEY